MGWIVCLVVILSGDNQHMYSVYYYNLRCDRLHIDLQLPHEPLQYIIIIVNRKRRRIPVRFCRMAHGTIHR